jgi:predicted DNA-binding helix-hairpin-helix protein
MFDLVIDPKLAWALQHRGDFPVDVNTAPRERLLRVPGLGTLAVDRIVASRRTGALRFADVARLTASMLRVRPFIITLDYQPGPLLDDQRLRAKLVNRPTQLSLFN